MTPQQIVDTKVAPCFGGGHIWRRTVLVGCEMCGGHGGFACDVCSRCVDIVADSEIYKAIVQIGYLEDEDEDDS